MVHMQSVRQTNRNGMDAEFDMLMGHSHATLVTVRRDAMFEDGFAAMQNLASDKVKGRLRMQFIDEFGEQEAGIDGGGLFKDFMEHLLQVGNSVCRPSLSAVP